MKIINKLLILFILLSTHSIAQTTPNLGLSLPVQGSPNWGAILNKNFTIIDTFAGTASTFPSSGTGLIFGLTGLTSRFATYADIVSLFGSGSCSGFLKSDGTCASSGGGSSAFSSLTSGTNTSAAMLIGTGSTLGFTGSGNISASSVPLSGITGFANGVETFLGVPSSANLATAMTNETGTGALVFATGPTITLANATGLSLSTGVTGNLPNVNLASQTENTVLGALTATTPSGLAMPSCSGGSNALIWTSGTGFGCNTISSGTGTVTHTVGNLTALQMIIGNGVSDEKVDTGCSTDGTGNLTCVGYSTNGNSNGVIALTSTGVSPGSAATSTIQIEAPNSVTAYRLQLPGNAPTSGNTLINCTVANPSVCSFGGNSLSASISTTIYTVSSLPSASSLPAGTQVTVSDDTGLPTSNTCTGSGSEYAIAITNGTSWSCH